eukprot:13847220-Alexandrium_andersonii.AAC.1
MRLQRAHRPASSVDSAASAQRNGTKHPSGASGANLEAVSWPVQFKLRTPHAISHVLGSDSSRELQGCLLYTSPSPRD